MYTDAQLQQDLIAELGYKPSVHTVPHVFSLKGPAVELHVQLPGLNNRTDAEITHAAENLLGCWTYLSTGMIKVKVDKGWITLSGQFDADYQRQAATAAICHLAALSESAIKSP